MFEFFMKFGGEFSSNLINKGKNNLIVIIVKIDLGVFSAVEKLDDHAN